MKERKENAKMGTEETIAGQNGKRNAVEGLLVAPFYPKGVKCESRDTRLVKRLSEREYHRGKKERLFWCGVSCVSGSDSERMCLHDSRD